MIVQLLKSPGQRKHWDDYVSQARDATHYHQVGWKDVIERSFGHRACYWMAQDERGEIQGVFPLIHLRSLFFGSFMVSLPYFNYGGVCATNSAARKVLVDAAIGWAQKQRAEHIEMRHDTITHDIDLPFKNSKVSMRLDLPSEGELWTSFNAKLRSQIRRPMKDGLVGRVGREEELDAFYKVFSRNMRDLGTPVYSKSFFRNILQTFSENVWIVTVYNKNIPVASGVLIGFRDTLEIPWASSLREYNSLSPNMLLYWTALRFACDRGFRVFDFGRSTPGSGTYRFKEQWGARPISLYWYYWMRSGGQLPDLSPSHPKYRLAIQVWKRLPVSFTRLIGPPIVKNLP